MKATPKKSKSTAPKPSSAAKPSPPGAKDDAALANPNAPEMEGGRRGSVDGKFEGDHRPSR